MATTVRKSISEQEKEFTAEHGGDPVPYTRGQLFPDGAILRWDGYGLKKEEPPDHPERRAVLRLRYATIRLASAESAYAAFGHNAVGGGRGGHPGTWVRDAGWDEKQLGRDPARDRKGDPASADDARLSRLRELVDERRQALEAVLADVRELYGDSKARTVETWLAMTELRKVDRVYVNELLRANGL